MVRKAISVAVISLIFLSACNFSSIFGGSVKLINNSDGEVIATMEGNESITIPAGEESQMISVDKDMIHNNRITVNLKGIYYEENTREYNVADRISLNPDCGWIEITNNTDLPLTELSARNGGSVHSSQDFEASSIASIEPGASFYMLITDFSSSLSLSFMANGEQHDADIRFSEINAKAGKTAKAAITVSEDGTFMLSLL